MIYVYQNSNGFRVVRGTNPVRAKEHTNTEPRVYRDEASAYAVETDAAIRGAILRLDPTAKGSVMPDKMHHVVKGSEFRANGERRPSSRSATITPRMHCDRCEMLSINEVACHEHRCPNMGARWDGETWIKQRECRECGSTVDASEECCEAQS